MADRIQALARKRAAKSYPSPEDQGDIPGYVGPRWDQMRRNAPPSALGAERARIKAKPVTNPELNPKAFIATNKRPRSYTA